MKKLQSIQESLNNQIGKALKSEKAKMALKQQRLDDLERAMTQIEKIKIVLKQALWPEKLRSCLCAWSCCGELFVQYFIKRVL